MLSVGNAIAIGTAAMGFLGAGDAGDAADEAEELYQQQARTAAYLRSLSQEQWNLWKEIYLPYEQARLDMQTRLMPTQEESAEAAMRGDIMDRETYEREVSPVLSQIIDDAMAGVEDRTDYVVGRAAADVATQFGVQREQTQRELERRGVRPGSGAYKAGVESTALTEAGARAREINVAREGESRRKEDLDWQRRTQAFNLGSALRQPRFPGGAAGVGGLTAQSPTAAGTSAAKAYGAAGTGYRRIAGEYGGAAGALGQAAGYFSSKYGDRQISDIFRGGTPRQTAAQTAGVTPGATGGGGGYPSKLYEPF